MFSYSLPFPKVSAKNIDYCGQKVEETDMAHMVSNYPLTSFQLNWLKMRTELFKNGIG